jgi:hypothetical protein
MRIPIYLGVGQDAGPPVGIVEILSDAIDERTLCEAALIPMLQKSETWKVVGWQLVPRVNVDTRHIELM